MSNFLSASTAQPLLQKLTTPADGAFTPARAVPAQQRQLNNFGQRPTIISSAVNANGAPPIYAGSKLGS